MSLRMEPLEGRLLLASNSVSFLYGSILPDTHRDLVYMVDKTDQRILAIDTNLGKTVSFRDLAGDPANMAESVSGELLFVTEPASKSIAVLSLPDLTPVASLNLDFTPGSIACGVNDRLYAYGTPSTNGHDLFQLDASTGAKLKEFGGSDDYNAILKTSTDGTRLFVATDAATEPAPGSLKFYDVTGDPSFQMSRALPPAHLEDFVVDETNNRIYTASDDNSGLGVVDIPTGSLTHWSIPGGASFPLHGVAIAMLPTGSFVYGANQVDLRQFDRSDGSSVTDYLGDARFPVTFVRAHVALTPNGNLFYTTAVGLVNVIGPASVIVDDVPVARVAATARGSDYVTFDARRSQPFRSGETITSYAWDFGDGTTGTGNLPTHHYSADGTYTATLTVTSSSGQTDSYSTVIAATTAPPAPFASLSAGVLTVSGTAGDDTIDVPPAGTGLRITLNGASETFLRSGISKVIFNEGGGDDVVTIEPVPLPPAVQFDGGAGQNTLTIGVSGYASPFTLGNGSFTDADSAFSFINTQSLTIQGDQGASSPTDTFNVRATTPGVTETIIGSLSNAFNLGDGNAAAELSGDLTLVGGGYTDVLHYDNHLASGDNTYEVSPTAISVSSAEAPGIVLNTINYSLIKTVQIDDGAGSSIFNLSGAPTHMTYDLSGGAGDDQFNLGDGTAGIELSGTLNIDGGDGTDSIHYDDHAGSYNPPSGYVGDSIAITNTTVTDTVHDNQGTYTNTITFPGIEAYQIDSPSRTPSVQFNYTATGTVFDLHGGDGYVYLALRAGNGANPIFEPGTEGGRVDFLGQSIHWTVNNDLGADGARVQIYPEYGGNAGNNSVTFNSSEHLSRLDQVDPTDFISITPGGNKVLEVDELAMASGCPLDLADNDMIVHAKFNGGLTGVTLQDAPTLVGDGSIFSSVRINRQTTLGVASASDIFGISGTQTALFDGQTVSATDVLIKYTYVGDANLDGKVNIDDYGRIDSNVGQSGSVFGWYNGDFNFDGKINIDDYGLIDGIIGAQGPVL